MGRLVADQDQVMVGEGQTLSLGELFRQPIPSKFEAVLHHGGEGCVAFESRTENEEGVVVRFWKWPLTFPAAEKEQMSTPPL